MGGVRKGCKEDIYVAGSDRKLDAEKMRRIATPEEAEKTRWTTFQAFQKENRRHALEAQVSSKKILKLSQGDLVHTVDFSNVYADLLGGWLKAPSIGKILGGNYKGVGML